MTDDPREILKAAGVECAEAEGFLNDLAPYWCPDCNEEHEREYSELNRRLAGDAMDAVLALARLVAKYKWLAEHEGHRVAGEWYIDSRCHEELAFLEREHEAKP